MLEFNVLSKMFIFPFKTLLNILERNSTKLNIALQLAALNLIQIQLNSVLLNTFFSGRKLEEFFVPPGRRNSEGVTTFFFWSDVKSSALGL
jgi:hypothetical protein